MAPSKQSDKALGRRKACDFCCRKKVKCDAKSPKCSNCIIHDAPCLWTPGVAAPKGVLKRPAPAESPSINLQWVSTVEQRLAAVEAMLCEQRMLPWPLLSVPQWQDVPTPDIFGPLPTPPPHADAENVSQPGASASSSSVSPAASPSHHSHQNSVGGGGHAEEEQFPLPPQHVVYPIISGYLADGNHALPIFDEPSMNAMIHEWYRFPEQRDQATWAVINVAIALGLQQQLPAATSTDSSISRGADDDGPKMQTCIANAQSVLDSLVTRDEDFKGLQTLLGLSVLFMYSASPKPACVLVAMAVKLVHRLQAHTRQGRENVNDEMTPLQRNRLFWATFILDRDLSVKTMEPYMQQDTEYDVELPSIDIPTDGVGVITSQDGTEKFNLFHYRVRLALLQGSLHDLIHSVKARGMPQESKKSASTRLGLQLWQWQRSIPEAFRSDKLANWANNSTGGFPRGLLALHLAFYLCFLMAHRLHIRDPDLVRKLQEFSNQFTGEMQQHDSFSSGGSNKSQSQAKLEDILPGHWYHFVDTARIVISLVNLIDPADSFLSWYDSSSQLINWANVYRVKADRECASIRSSVCSYQAALTVLVANKLTVSLHHLYQDIDADTQHIKKGMEVWRVRVIECGFMASKQASLKELHDRADLAMQAYSADVTTSLQTTLSF